VSVWNQDRLGGGTGLRHALGLWHPRARLASASLMPGTRERKKLRGKVPFYYVFDFKGMLPGATANDRISVTSDFWPVQYTIGVVAQNEVNATSFALNLFETRAKQRFMSLPLLQQVSSPLFVPAPLVGFDATFGGTLASSALATPLMQAGFSNQFGLPFFHRKITKIARNSELLMQIKDLRTFTSQTADYQVVLGGYID
jgi:hypothetical protein